MNCDFGLQNSAYVIENLASEEGSLEDVLGLPGAYLLVWIEFISSCLSMPWVFPSLPVCLCVCVCDSPWSFLEVPVCLCGSPWRSLRVPWVFTGLPEATPSQ
jgi:hypothetical protein